MLVLLQVIGFPFYGLTTLNYAYKTHFGTQAYGIAHLLVIIPKKYEGTDISSVFIHCG